MHNVYSNKEKEKKKMNQPCFIFFFLFFLLTNAQYDYSHMKKERKSQR